MATGTRTPSATPAPLPALFATDLRNIARDSMLRFLLLYPVVIGLLMRWLIPLVTRSMADRIDLTQYYPLLGSFFGLLVMPALTGTVVGFLMLDERDSGTLRALQVTPLSMDAYLLYRVGFQLVLCVLGSYIFVALMGIFPVSWLQLLPLALLGALEAPLFAMLFVSIAANKVQGVAAMKGLSFFMVAPFVAWFVPLPWQWLFGILPTFWPLKAAWLLMDGEPYAWAIGVGLLVVAAYTLPILRLYRRRVYRA